MTKQEWNRLKQYAKFRSSSQWYPIYRNTGRAAIKARAKGTGQILKRSTIRPQVHLETLFLARF